MPASHFLPQQDSHCGLWAGVRDRGARAGAQPERSQTDSPPVEALRYKSSFLPLWSAMVYHAPLQQDLFPALGGQRFKGASRCWVVAMSCVKELSKHTSQGTVRVLTQTERHHCPHTSFRQIQW